MAQDDGLHFSAAFPRQLSLLKLLQDVTFNIFVFTDILLHLLHVFNLFVLLVQQFPGNIILLEAQNQVVALSLLANGHAI